MKLHWDNKYFYWGMTGFLMIAASLLFYFGIFHMGILIDGIKRILNIFMPILYGAAIAYLLNPLLKFYENTLVYPFLEKKKVKLTSRKRKFIRYFGVLLAVAFMLMIVYTLIIMILPEIIKSIVNIINNFPLYVDSVRRWITHVLENNADINNLVVGTIDRYSLKMEQYLTQDILPQMQNLLLHFSSGILEVITFLKNALVGIIVSIYILADKEIFRGKVKMAFFAILPEKKAEKLLESLRFTDRTFGGFIGGKIMDSFIIGVLCYIGISILKMPYTVLVSVIIGVTNVIPFFGPYLGAIPCAFLILLVSPIKCLYFIIFILVLQQFDGNVLGPKILGNSTGLSSFMVILSILIGGGLFGVFGMFIGVPVCAVIYAMCWRMINRSLKKKNLSTKIQDYQ